MLILIQIIQFEANVELSKKFMIRLENLIILLLWNV